MIIVADATPIITFLKIDRLDLLQKMYGTIKIPKAVFAELTSNEEYQVESEKIKKYQFFDVIEVNDFSKTDLLMRATGLDLGESEALILADEIKADVLIMDEAHGRLVAKQMGFSITGSIGVLIAAYNANLITSDEIKKYVEIFKTNHRFISRTLLSALLELTNAKE